MIRHQAEGLARCFVLLSVDLGTEILSSDPILSALTACGRPYGAPRGFDLIRLLSRAPQVVRAFHLMHAYGYLTIS